MATKEKPKGDLVKTKRNRSYKISYDEVCLAKIEGMKEVGMTHRQVAAYLGIAYSTFLENARDIPDLRRSLDAGLAKGVNAVAGALFKKAIKGNVDAAKFFLKTKGGFTEKLEVDVTHKAVVFETQLRDNRVKQDVKEIGVQDDLLSATIIDLTPVEGDDD
jgi:hypothetical protein